MSRLRRMLGYYRLGRATWDFYWASHSDRLGHDDHCPCPSSTDWATSPQPNCLCGWANLRQSPARIRDGAMTEAIKTTVTKSAHDACQRIMEAINDDPEIRRGNVAHVLGETAFLVGIDVGLALAIQDVAAARKLMQWIFDNVQEGDQDLAHERDRFAGELLAVLGFEHD